MEQPAVSHQLRVLRDLGLVIGNRSGRNVVYGLFDSHVASLIDEALRHIDHVATDDLGPRPKWALVSPTTVEGGQYMTTEHEHDGPHDHEHAHGEKVHDHPHASHEHEHVTHAHVHGDEHHAHEHVHEVHLEDRHDHEHV